MALVAIALTIVTFIMTKQLTSEEVEIKLARKLGIGICSLSLLIFHIVSGKLNKVINRRIQAYETAKEIGAAGRSSIIWTNILKLFEIFFPEILVLLIICFCVS